MRDCGFRSVWKDTIIQITVQSHVFLGVQKWDCPVNGFSYAVKLWFGCHESSSDRSNVICCFYQTVMIFLDRVVFIAIILKFEIVGSIPAAVERSHDVTSVETAFDFISAQLVISRQLPELSVFIRQSSLLRLQQSSALPGRHSYSEW